VFDPQKSGAGWTIYHFVQKCRGSDLVNDAETVLR